MGVERAVTLWYIQRQFILDEITHLEGQCTQASTLLSADAAQPDRSGQEKVAELKQQLAKARARLHAQGPCPKPMMG